MGCDRYVFEDVSIQFGEDVACLCMWPFNKELSPEHLRLLAMIGAAVVLIHHDSDTDGGSFMLPKSLPDWVVQGIDLLIKNEREVTMNAEDFDFE